MILNFQATVRWITFLVILHWCWQVPRRGLTLPWLHRPNGRGSSCSDSFCILLTIYPFNFWCTAVWIQDSWVWAWMRESWCLFRGIGFSIVRWGLRGFVVLVGWGLVCWRLFFGFSWRVTAGAALLLSRSLYILLSRIYWGINMCDSSWWSNKGQYTIKIISFFYFSNLK